MRRRNSDRFDISVCEREHYVAWRDLAHEVIERISPTIAIALGRPQIPAQHLVPVRLILVYPPVSHRLCRLRSVAQFGTSRRSTLASATIRAPSAIRYEIHPSPHHSTDRKSIV